MDRSFLSDPAVVAATRDFVCIRAATYENAEEVPFLTSLFRGRSAEMENTVFALLDPDGKTRISNGGRSPQMAFRTEDKQQIIKRLGTVADNYEVKETKSPDRLPFAASLRLGLNVAACDNQPLLLCLADTPEDLRRIEKALSKHVWNESLIGQYHYVSSSKDEASEVTPNLTVDSGIVIIQPDQFGTRGEVLVEHAAGDGSKPLLATLKAGLEAFDRKTHRDTRDHVRQGKQSGVHWETATPITDSGGPRRRKGPPR